MRFKVRRGSFILRILHEPILAETSNKEYAMRSRLTWLADSPNGPYRLTLLGLLNGLFGLVLQIEARNK